MINALKYIAIILACIVLLVGISQLRRCGAQSSSTTPVSLHFPADTNFQPVEYSSYQPPSLPFVNKTSGVRLPDGVKEKDVEKIVTVTLRDGIGEIQDTGFKMQHSTIDIIETEDGEIFVRRDSLIESVRVIRFEPQVVSPGWRFGVGASCGFTGIDGTPGNAPLRVSPMGLFAPLEWFGWLHAPIITADLDGIGVGAQARVYHDFYAGAYRVWRYNSGGEVKLGVGVVF